MDSPNLVFANGRPPFELLLWLDDALGDATVSSKMSSGFLDSMKKASQRFATTVADGGAKAMLKVRGKSGMSPSTDSNQHVKFALRPERDSQGSPITDRRDDLFRYSRLNFALLVELDFYPRRTSLFLNATLRRGNNNSDWSCMKLCQRIHPM